MKIIIGLMWLGIGVFFYIYGIDSAGSDAKIIGLWSSIIIANIYIANYL